MSKDVIRWGSVSLPSRRLLLGVAGGLLLLYTLLGFFVVPRIIRSQIVSGAREQLHREAQVGDVRFNPFTLAATVTGLRLRDRDGADLITVDGIHANADTFGLFRWALRFSEIRIEHPVVAARIMRDGKPSVADLMEGGSSSEPFELPRLIVDRLQLTSGVVHFTDASRQPAYDTRFEPLNLDVTDLITIPQEGGEHALTIGVCDGAQLKWTGRQTVEPLRFSGRLDVTGIRLASLWDYFAADQPLDVREGRADIALPYEIRRGASAPFEVNLKGASAQVRGLTARPRDGMTDWLTLPDTRAEGVNVAWPKAHAEVARLAVTEPRIVAFPEEDGRWNWERALNAGNTPPASDATPWTWRVGVVEVARGGVRVEHATGQDAPPIELADISLTVKDLTQNLALPLAIASKARVQESGTIEAQGTIAPSPLAVDMAFEASSIALAPFQPYFVMPAATHITTGTLAMKGRASMPAGAGLSVSADGSVDAVELRDKDERLVAWKRMAIEGFTFEPPPSASASQGLPSSSASARQMSDRARIRTVTLDEAFAKILIDPQGNLNLARLSDNENAAATRATGAGSQQAPASSDAAAKASGDESGQRRPPTLEVGNIVVRNASTDFTDLSLPLSPFNAQIHSANGTIRDLSTFAAAPATVAIEGRVDKTGYVKVGGTLRTSNPMASSEISVEFRSIDMANLTPYFAQFAGYRVQRGVLDLDVRYQVQSRRLIGNHKVVARDLVLGERVKDSKGPGFAIRLALALLKDREGRINVDVPIEGTVDDPKFNYRQVFWDAMKTILGNAAKAPFRALGRMFGRDEDDLELVEFDPGRTDLLPADQEMLTRLGEQLVQRGDLSLEIEGRFDPKVDPPAMRQAKLEQLIEARRPAATAAAPVGSSALETILEGLFAEQFSAAALAAERQKFITSPAPAAPASTDGSAAPLPAAPVTPAITAQTSAAGATPGFDASGFYESLRQKLLDAQQVAPAELARLGAARADTILAVLTKAGIGEAARIKNLEPAAVKRSKKGSSRIASEMKMSGGDEPEE